MLVDSYDDCWLGYDQIMNMDRRTTIERRCRHAYVAERSPELGAVRDELRVGLSGLLGTAPHLWQHPPRSVEAFLAVGLREDMRPVRDVIEEATIQGLHDDGYVLQTGEWEGQDILVVTAATDRGLVYGTFGLLRRLALGASVDDIDVVEEHTNAERVINHWDNPYLGHIERGFAGRSIFDWERLPDLRDRYFDYARLLSSVGINGIVINNVNTETRNRETTNEATQARHGWQLLASEQLRKVEALASVFRRYGIQIYLSVNYAAPMLVGDLDTADPLDPEVGAWWAEKAEEIYDLIPDFGGFLVKADSEGQNGPHDYGRNHAEGANVLARALAPHGGRVWWRAFVYGTHEDRAVQPYEMFEPLDGEFHDAVTLQIKNGPVDFQPREPVSTLFGAMPNTNLGCELQITQEYTGQAVHACYHVPMWTEILEFDTYADGKNTPVKDLLAGEDGQGLAGVSNVGEDINWFGNDLSGANLYGYGRLCWDPDLDAKPITEEWATQTFGHDSEVVETVTDILLDSWEATVNYETGGLGLLHMMYAREAALEKHYDPSPEEWPEYTGANEDGIGIDRTETGSSYTEQYNEPHTSRYADPERCPDELLLFFHHLPWDYELADGTPLIQQLYDNHYDGVEKVRNLRECWRSLEGRIEDSRFRRVAERFNEQVYQAQRWRDEICAFYYRHAGIPDDKGRIVITDDQ